MMPRWIRTLVVAGGVVSAAGTATAQTVNAATYAWQFPAASGVNAPDLVGRAQEEVQKVLDAGRLTPQRAYYGDLGNDEQYWQYIEPGRIVTTLAWAYPYLTTTQQAGVRSYVAAELASATHAPWATALLSPTVSGTRRELHPLNRPTYLANPFGANHPSVHTLYGLWLYAYRTGDWALVQSHWPEIVSMYNARSGQADIYGTMSAHIAVARLADRFGDTAIRTTALDNLQAQLDAGRDFALVESRTSSKWPEMYDARRLQGHYAGWMFLNLSPEMGRYLNDNVRTASLARHNSGKTMYPLWWLRLAPYFTRWTGDESIGTPTELIGMMAPVERWVVGASAATLRDEVRSGPTAIGDCYWVEALVQAVEATGTSTWTDVRTGGGPPPPTAPSAPTGLRIVVP
jgi:hypothetical protein